MDHHLALSARRAASRHRLATWLALAPILLLTGLAMAGPVLSGDLWWHLRTGAWLLQEGALPSTDPFSHTAGETPWILQEYASQILFALVHAAAGFSGLRALGAALALCLLVCVFRTARRSLSPSWAGCLTAFFALLFALKWELRPHLISALFFLRIAGTLFPRSWGAGPAPGPRAWLEVGLLACLWVQLHAEALFAVFLPLAGLIGAALAAIREPGGDWGKLRAWGVTVLAALLGTLASPLGSTPHYYALIKRSVPRQYIEEWFSPFIGSADPRFEPLTTGVWHTFLLFLVAGGLLVSVQAWRRLRTRGQMRGLSWEYIGFLALCIAFALQARRFLWLAWFPGLEVVSAVLGSVHSLAARRAFPMAATLFLAFPLWQSHFVQRSWSALAGGEYGATVDERLFPSVAADFVAGSGLRGNLFHPYEWGGYLGFRTELPVFVDGRTVLFEKIIPERWRAERDPAVAREVFERRDVRVIVFKAFVNHGEGWQPWAPPGDRKAWVRVWSDALARVWVRVDDEENLALAASWFEEQDVSFDPEQGFLEAAGLAAHPEWLASKRLLDQKVAEELEPSLEGAAARTPHSSLDRAELWWRHRMRRNARHDFERWALAGGREHAPPGGWDTYAQTHGLEAALGAARIAQSRGAGSDSGAQSPPSGGAE